MMGSGSSEMLQTPTSRAAANMHGEPMGEFMSHPQPPRRPFQRSLFDPEPAGASGSPAIPCRPAVPPRGPDPLPSTRIEPQSDMQETASVRASVLDAFHRLATT